MGRYNTRWDMEFARDGVLMDMKPDILLFVCAQGARPYAPESSEFSKDGKLLAGWRHGIGRPPIPVPSRVASFQDSLDTFQSWLGHHSSDKPDIELDDITCKRLIDCKDLAVVPADRSMSYIALSYVWSQAKTYSVQQDGRRSFEEISLTNSRKPGTSRDKSQEFFARSDGYDAQGSKPLGPKIPGVIWQAIQTVLKLGYRHLWVDQYCVDQNDPDELGNQIRLMDMIYNEAFLTIVACNSYGLLDLPSVQHSFISAHPGILLLEIPEPRSNSISNSLWASRAWTLQEEATSLRRLFYTDNGLFYRKGHLIWDGRWRTSDTLLKQSSTDPGDTSEPMIPLDRKDDESTVWSRMSVKLRDILAEHRVISDANKTFWGVHRAWNELATEYTSRSLSYETDINFGFVGIAWLLTSETEGIISGLGWIPFATKPQHVPQFLKCSSQESSMVISEDFRQTQQKSLILGLSWFSEQPERARRRQPAVHFASWSWSGWHGRAVWPDEKSLAAEVYGNLFTNHARISRVGYLCDVSVPIEAMSFFHHDTPGYTRSDCTNSENCVVNALELKAHYLKRKKVHKINQSLHYQGRPDASYWSVKVVSMNSTGRADHDPTDGDVSRPLSEDDVWNLVDRGSMGCAIMGEVVINRVAHLFCLVVGYRSWDLDFRKRKKSAERRGFMLLERTLDQEEEHIPLLRGLDCLEETVLLY